MCDMTKNRPLLQAAALLLGMSFSTNGCGADSAPAADAQQPVATTPIAGAVAQTGAVAGRAGAIATAPIGPMPGLGTMLMNPSSGSAGAAAGASGAAASTGGAGQAGVGAISTGQAGGAAGPHAGA